MKRTTKLKFKERKIRLQPEKQGAPDILREEKRTLLFVEDEP